MTRHSSDRLNEYANSIFRFERLSPAWVEACAGYLSRVFGDLRGTTVIDYAFGRGNWSLGFLRAGAAHIIAIDASEDAVRRFSDYCRTHAIAGVEVIHGDVLVSPIARTADRLWIYGVLSHVDDAEIFVDRIRDMARVAAAEYLFYAYDAGSLRQFVVDTCRTWVEYGSEQEFIDDSYVFTRPARMRARDDLTAPIVNWHTLKSLSALLRRHGLYPTAQTISFAEFQLGMVSEEFCPHHLLCRLTSELERDIPEPESPYSEDVTALYALADKLARVSTAAERRRAALGLFNTHFSSLGTDGAAAPALREDFLFLFHLLLRKDVVAEDLRDPAASLYALAIKAMSDDPRDPGAARGSFLHHYLATNRIRI